ncbi:hypothetical protein AC1031_007943 [Aphanomyces cochlioides]|nr:hypothetical protein AC1031_007943 [Aphanomyces cochlioides]
MAAQVHTSLAVRFPSNSDIFRLSLTPTSDVLTIQLQSMLTLKIWECKVSDMNPRKGSCSAMPFTEFASIVTAAMTLKPSAEEHSVQWDLHKDTKGSLHLLVAIERSIDRQVDGFSFELMEKRMKKAVCAISRHYLSGEMLIWEKEEQSHDGGYAISDSGCEIALLKAGEYLICGRGNDCAHMTLYCGGDEIAKTELRGSTKRFGKVITIQGIAVLSLVVQTKTNVRSFQLTIDELN